MTTPAIEVRDLIKRYRKGTANAVDGVSFEVESGEFFRRHQKSFNPAHRVDRDLLDNLQATREKLVASDDGFFFS